VMAFALFAGDRKYAIYLLPRPRRAGYATSASPIGTAW
jgi:hypothetical protein